MNKWLLGAVLILLTGAGGWALAQSHPSTGQVAPQVMAHSVRSVTRYLIPLTPTGQARLDHVTALDAAARDALSAGQYQEAEADARQSIAISPLNSGWSEEILARALYAQGKMQEALQVYKSLSDAGGVSPRNELPYALLLLNEGRWAPAASAYNRALPYLADGDLVRANSAFSPTVPQPTELATAVHIALGLTHDGGEYTGNHEDEKALSEYEAALALAPDSVLANYYYGYGWQKLDPNSQLRKANAVSAKEAVQKAATSSDPDMKKAAEKALMGFK